MTSPEIHLDEMALKSLELTDWERRVSLQRPQATFKMNDFQRITEKLELMFQAGPHFGARYMLLQGYVGSGKSTILYDFALNHPRIRHDNGEVEIPVIYCVVPADPTENKLSECILEAIGVPQKERSSVKPPLLARRFMNTNKVRMLILDEIQHVNLARTGKKTSVILDAIKVIGNNLGIPVVCGGTRKVCQLLLDEDKALHRRFVSPEEPDLYSQKEDLFELLKVIEPTIGLKRAKSLTTDSMVDVIAENNNGTIDSIYIALRSAAQYAIETGEEHIHENTFSDMGWEFPDLSDGSRG